MSEVRIAELEAQIKSNKERHARVQMAARERILSFMAHHTGGEGSPSWREVAAHFGVGIDEYRAYVESQGGSVRQVKFEELIDLLFTRHMPKNNGHDLSKAAADQPLQKQPAGPMKEKDLDEFLVKNVRALTDNLVKMQREIDELSKCLHGR